MDDRNPTVPRYALGGCIIKATFFYRSLPKVVYKGLRAISKAPGGAL
jgi:hypothetical protein